MAITLTPCDASGNTVSRSVWYKAVEAPDPRSDETPHLKIRYDNTVLETATLVVQAEIRAYTGQSYYVDKLDIEMLTFPVNEDFIYAYPTTIDQIISFMPIDFPSSSSPTITEVKYFVKVDSFAASEDTVQYSVYPNIAREARARIGYPHLSDNTVLERGTGSGSSFVVNPDGKRLRVKCGIIRPPHLALGVRARVQIKERVGNNTYTRASGTPAQITVQSYVDTETTASGNTSTTSDLTDRVRVDIFLECNSPYDPNTWTQVEKVSKWISFLPPVFATNFFGDGVSFGMLPSQSSKVLEVASDWDANFNGDVNIAGELTMTTTTAKQSILDLVYPVGISIFAQEESKLDAIIANMPGTWVSTLGTLQVPTMQGGYVTLYMATRSA